MKCKHCNGDTFFAHQVCRLDIIVDSEGEFLDNAHGDANQAISDAGDPYGPFQCCTCGAEYDGDNLEDAKEISGPSQNWTSAKRQPLGELHLMTISQLAEFIAGQLDYSKIWESKFPACDFTVTDAQEMTQYSQKDLEAMHHNANGWCGIKPVNFGFNSTNLYAVTDYYGGGCDQVCRLYDGIYVIETEVLLCEAIRYTLCAAEEAVTDETILLVEIRKEAE